MKTEEDRALRNQECYLECALKKKKKALSEYQDQILYASIIKRENKEENIFINGIKVITKKH